MEIPRAVVAKAVDEDGRGAGDPVAQTFGDGLFDVAPQARIGEVVPVPLTPFLAAGDLLYQGPWVAERLAEFDEFLTRSPGSVHPVVAAIIEGGRRWTAVDAFRATYRLQELKAEVARLFEHVDVVVLPTIATTFTVAEVLADPIGTNTALGLYTHCGNLLDLCAAAVPAGYTEDGRPCSLMVLGPALADDVVLDVAARLTGTVPAPAPAPAPAGLPPRDPLTTEVVVVGHHLSGQTLEGDDVEEDLMRQPIVVGVEGSAAAAGALRWAVAEGARWRVPVTAVLAKVPRAVPQRVGAGLP